MDFCGFARVCRTAIVRGEGVVQAAVIWSMASWKGRPSTRMKKSMALPARSRSGGTAALNSYLTTVTAAERVELPAASKATACR